MSFIFKEEPTLRIINGIRPLQTSLIALATVALLQGCLLATAVIRPVAESDKDTSGTYDGRWTGLVTRTAKKQVGPGNWTFNCNDRSGDKYMIDINNGTVTTNYNNLRHSTFINTGGKFRFEIPTERAAKAAGTSDKSINNGDITVILVGALDEPKAGSVTFSIAELNAGCSSTIAYTQQ